MIDRATTFIQAQQPVNVTNAILHIMMHLTSSFQPSEYENPYHNDFNATHAESQKMTVYGIFGTGDNHAALQKMSKRLMPFLPDYISAIRIPVFKKRYRGLSIDDFANQLAEQIELNGDKRIILFCHSRGGLVALRYALEYAAKQGVEVYQVITLGTPFRGSGWAKYFSWASQSVAEMVPNSPFLQELSEKMKNSGLNIFHCAAEKDFIVDLQSATNEADQSQVKVYRNHGHLSLLSSNKLIADIRDNQFKDLIKTLQTAHPEENWQQAYEEVVETILNDFADLSADKDPLSDLMYEITTQIQSIKSHYHLINCQKKIAVLEELLKDLEYISGFSEVERLTLGTIDAYINHFLTQNATSFPAENRLNILKQPLNDVSTYLGVSVPGINLFKPKKSDTELFITKIIDQFKEVTFAKPNLSEKDSPSLH